MPDDPSWSIGEVINLLKSDFPEVSVSKVRFLENQGLLAPARTESGYRQFTPGDVDRLRFILEQQRDHFLPLKVIKSKLADWDRDHDSAAPPDTDSDLFDPDNRHLDDKEFRRLAGLTVKELNELVDQGLIRRMSDGGLLASSVAIGREARVLLDLGLEPRHLRVLRLSVDREADILRQLSAPQRRTTSPEGRAKAREMLTTAAKSFEVLHLGLLRQEMQAILDE